MVWKLLSMLLLAAPPHAAEPSGRYRLQGGPDVVSELVLYPDGHFEYGLSAGALDEGAKGSWVRQGPQVLLTTVPRPVAPVFTTLPPIGSADTPMSVKVVAPNGEGIAGVDFEIGFADGSSISDYTQEYGWSLPDGDLRRPVSIQLSVPMHQFVSPRIDLDSTKGSAFTFQLTPNDLGLVDFEGEPLDVEPDRLTMHRGEGRLAFIRTGDATSP